MAMNFGWGVYGVWIGMYIDWVVRSIAFIRRFARGKMERDPGDLKFPPKPFKSVELSEFLTHQMNDDIPAVDQFPPVSGGLLLAVGNGDTPAR